jgi:hypothetical protein
MMCANLIKRKSNLDLLFDDFWNDAAVEVFGYHPNKIIYGSDTWVCSKNIIVRKYCMQQKGERFLKDPEIYCLSLFSFLGYLLLEILFVNAG